MVGERVLMSDGNIIVISYYILTDNHINFFYTNQSIIDDFDPQWWMPLPDLPPKIQQIGVDKEQD